MKQGSFLSDFHRDIPMGPRGVTLPPVTQQRLSRQCAAILARLQQGPVTNRDLSQLALSYTRRLSDLREAGYAVECYRSDEATGVNWYRLTGDSHADSRQG
jgi:hypothetical protein